MNGSSRGPVVLVVLDGWGLRAERDHNAIALARTPVYRELLDRFPHASLVASGEAVGLPDGQMGNSEVGHMNMGAGRVVYQDLTRIDKSIRDGEFFDNAALVAAMDRCDGDRHALHLLGLLSDGGVHSHQRHLYALLHMAARRGVGRVYVHALMDGRDAPPNAGVEYLASLERQCTDAGVGRVATVCGRYYGMDRDKRWERTARAYDAITRGVGTSTLDAVPAVRVSYAAGITDEFIAPIVIVNHERQPIGLVKEDDSLILFNFRADRARQLTRALAFDDFDGFERGVHPRVHVTTMTMYDATFGLPIAFAPQTFAGAMAEVLAQHQRTNLRLAETEKYAHVTYFFNCGEERPYIGEQRILVPSARVATYDLKPEMSAVGITDALVADLAARQHDVVICNFANADMVGHTGRLEATIAAVETLDRCLGRIVPGILVAGGTLLLTADHGNAEQMWDDERQCPHTAHTSNPVPVVLVGAQARGINLRDGWLRDVAPTLLGLLAIEPPAEMTGRDLRVLGSGL